MAGEGEEIVRQAYYKKMEIYKIVVGPIATNCYILADSVSREAIIIDPGDDVGKIIDTVLKNQLKPKAVILTHSHFDHVGALEEVKKKFGIERLEPKEGDEIKIGGIVLRVIETPGHAEDGICIINEKEGVVFSGDTLFKSGIGRTDLEGGDYNKIQKSLARLMEFPDPFKVFPGHGSATMIGEERGRETIN